VGISPVALRTRARRYLVCENYSDKATTYGNKANDTLSHFYADYESKLLKDGRTHRRTDKITCTEAYYRNYIASSSRNQKKTNAL